MRIVLGLSCQEMANELNFISISSENVILGNYLYSWGLVFKKTFILMAKI